jgi:hypothetical protein
MIAVRIHPDTLGDEILKAINQRSATNARQWNRRQSIKYLLYIKSRSPEAYTHHRNKHLKIFA